MIDGYEQKDEKGLIVYQEGKSLHDTFYVFSVYHNSDRGHITFRAYDIESNETLLLTYNSNDYDSLFKDEIDLLNPKNRDGRYQWVIERLDIVSIGGVRQLFLT